MSVPSSSSVRLKLKLPQDLGYDYDGLNTDTLDIREWRIFKGIVDQPSSAVTYDNGTLIDANTLLTTDPALFQGAIRGEVDLVKTTEMEWTVTGLDPNTTYVFKICSRNHVSLCVDNMSDPSQMVKPSVGILGNLR